MKLFECPEIVLSDDLLKIPGNEARVSTVMKGGKCLSLKQCC